MKKIVVDMMGSDLGSIATKEGVSLFHAKHPDVELILVGKEAELKDIEFAKIVNAEVVIENMSWIGPMTDLLLEITKTHKQGEFVLITIMENMPSKNV